MKIGIVRDNNHFSARVGQIGHPTKMVVLLDGAEKLGKETQLIVIE